MIPLNINQRLTDILKVSVIFFVLSIALKISYADETSTLIKVFNVGYGDAVFFQADGFKVLIDSGEREQAEKLLQFFHEKQIDRIQLGVITHPHKNHFGGFLDLLEKVKFDRLIINGDMNGEEGFGALMEQIKIRKIPFVTVKRGDFISNLPPEMTIAVLHPDKLEYSTNGNSIVLWITYKTRKILLTADIEPLQQDDILIHFPEVLNADLVQIPHHGGELSRNFIEAFRDKTVFVSTGKNDYGLPLEEYLKQFQGKIYRTDLEGHLTINIP